MSWYTSRDPARAGLPVDRWPALIRAAWLDASTPRQGPFRKNGGGVRRTRDTFLKSEKGLRRWLGFLHRLGVLNDQDSPLRYLTPELLDQFFEHLVAAGNADRSVVGRFQELELAYRLMNPGRHFGWLTKPDGVPLEHVLPMGVRPRFTPGSDELLEWADELYQNGLTKRDAQVRCALIRDALMIGILATRAPRLRALWSLQLGVHVVREGADWLLVQKASITKTRKEIWLPLSAEIGAMADRYVSTERLYMLRGQISDAFWIQWHGGPLAKSSISGLIWRRTLERFGVGFGPHRFRASLTTTLAEESPSAAFDAAGILGHTPKTSLSNYNRAKAIHAGIRHANRLQKLRQQTEDLAQQAFERGL